MNALKLALIPALFALTIGAAMAQAAAVNAQVLPTAAGKTIAATKPAAVVEPAMATKTELKSATATRDKTDLSNKVLATSQIGAAKTKVESNAAQAESSRKVKHDQHARAEVMPAKQQLQTHKTLANSKVVKTS